MLSVISNSFRGPLEYALAGGHSRGPREPELISNARIPSSLSFSPLAFWVLVRREQTPGVSRETLDRLQPFVLANVFLSSFARETEAIGRLFFHFYLFCCLTNEDCNSLVTIRKICLKNNQTHRQKQNLRRGIHPILVSCSDSMPSLTKLWRASSTEFYRTIWLFHLIILSPQKESSQMTHCSLKKLLYCKFHYFWRIRSPSREEFRAINRIFSQN